MLVIGENVEEQLEMYDEGKRVSPYLYKDRMELLEEYKEVLGNEFYAARYFGRFRTELYNLEFFAMDYYGMEVDSHGNLLTTYNPKSKWDYWTIGGRWDGAFLLKNGARSSQAEKKDIDFEEMDKKRKEVMKEKWEEAHNVEKLKEKLGEFEGAAAKGFIGWLYDIRPDDTLEKYIERRSRFCTFAVVKDGKWYEKGEMGWWGMVSNEKEQEVWQNEFASLLEGLPEDTLLTVVDCHI